MNLAGKDLNLVIALRALLEEGNVTRAGERLGVGQSGTSSALARLRSHYKDELLVRVGRGYELTPRARLLLPLVQKAVPLLEESLGVGGSLAPVAQRRYTIMLSDFASLQLHDHLRQVRQSAPIRVDLLPLPENPADSESALLSHDFIVAVPGIGVEGDFSRLFADYYVCLVDVSNPAVADGVLTWDAFTALPHAAASFGLQHHTPADRRLHELGFVQKPQVTTSGLLPLPSVVGGTNLIAVVPSELARRFGPSTGTIGVEAPFGRVELLENLWWHTSRSSDPGHRWLRTRLLESFTRGLEAAPET